MKRVTMHLTGGGQYGFDTNEEQAAILQRWMEAPHHGAYTGNAQDRKETVMIRREHVVMLTISG